MAESIRKSSSPLHNGLTGDSRANATTTCTNNYSMVSFNLHGLNQGSQAITYIINYHRPSIILLQEHWLTQANLLKLDRFDGYFAFGSSAMDSAVALDPIFG
jgi:hypothetical protein